MLNATNLVCFSYDFHLCIYSGWLTPIFETINDYYVQLLQIFGAATYSKSTHTIKLL